MIELEVNGHMYKIEIPPETPLLWVLRDHLNLMGTKYCCGIGVCGSCLVHVDGRPERSCQLAIEDASGSHIVTIEGLSEDHPVKRAWIIEQVPQCGYCQPGQIMQAAALLADHPNPTEEKIHQYMDEVLCRCGTYPRIKRAIQTASRLIR